MIKKVVLYVWKFDQGVTKTTYAPGTSFTYQEGGEKKIVLTVFDAEGLKSVSSQTIFVNPNETPSKSSLSSYFKFEIDDGITELTFSLNKDQAIIPYAFDENGVSTLLQFKQFMKIKVLHYNLNEVVKEEDLVLDDNFEAIFLVSPSHSLKFELIYSDQFFENMNLEPKIFTQGNQNGYFFNCPSTHDHVNEVCLKKCEVDQNRNPESGACEKIDCSDELPGGVYSNGRCICPSSAPRKTRRGCEQACGENERETSEQICASISTVLLECRCDEISPILATCYASFGCSAGGEIFSGANYGGNSPIIDGEYTFRVEWGCGDAGAVVCQP